VRDLLDGSGLSLALALLGAFILAALLRSTSKVIYWLPMSRRGLSRARQWLPVVATSVSILYVVVAARWLLNDIPYRDLIPAAVLLLMVAASWKGIRDATDGLFLRATGACRPGDYVQLDGLAGRIRDLGWRFMTLETSEGHVATIPYGQVARSSLRRLPEVKHGLLHVFRLELPVFVALPLVKRGILRAALLCPWCVPKRTARIRTLEQGKALEVTLALVDADHATEAEEVIREAVRALGRSGETSAREPGSGDAPGSNRYERSSSSHPPTARERPDWSIPSPSGSSPGLGRTGARER
jgi:hypothetical protein